MDDRAFVIDENFRRTCADVGEADSHFAFVAAQHGIGAGERFENRVGDFHARAVDRSDDILHRAGGGGKNVDANFEARGHHAERVVNAWLSV